MSAYATALLESPKGVLVDRILALEEETKRLHFQLRKTHICERVERHHKATAENALEFAESERTTLINLFQFATNDEFDPDNPHEMAQQIRIAIGDLRAELSEEKRKTAAIASDYIELRAELDEAQRHWDKADRRAREAETQIKAVKVRLDASPDNRPDPRLIPEIYNLILHASRDQE